MASPIVRKKRNFKALQLDVTKPPSEPPQTQQQPVLNTAKKEPITIPIATRNAPTVAPIANGRRRPAPIVLADPKLKASAAPVNDENLLTVMSTPHSAPATGSISATRPGLHTDLTQKLATMDMNAETKLDLRNEDLKELQELGQGNGGSVKKVEHVPTGQIMAKKVCFLHLTRGFVLSSQWLS